VIPSSIASKLSSLFFGGLEIKGSLSCINSKVWLYLVLKVDANAWQSGRKKMPSVS
jgi:hypothetical protein